MIKQVSASKGLMAFDEEEEAEECMSPEASSHFTTAASSIAQHCFLNKRCNDLCQKEQAHAEVTDQAFNCN